MKKLESLRSYGMKYDPKKKMCLFLRGPLCQWFPSEFVFSGKTFNCAEQFMMWAKAVLFVDYETAEKILAEKSPREQKKLGRLVQGYTQEKWDSAKFTLVSLGNVLKFKQNPELQEFLMKFPRGTVFVECNPHDSVWGIGRTTDDPLSWDKDSWRGDNLLGTIISNTRDALEDDNPLCLE